MEKTAFLFNGIGTKPEKLRESIPFQYQDKYDKYIAELFEKYNLNKIIKDNSINDQLVASAFMSAVADRVMYQAFLDKGIVPDYGCGYSLGIVNMCACFKAISFSDSYKIIQKNHQTIKKIRDENKSYDMGIIIGLEYDTINELIDKFEQRNNVIVGSVNSKICSMISGTSDGITKILEEAQLEGALKVVKMNIGISYHNAFMKQYIGEYCDQICKTQFMDSEYPIVSVFSQEKIKTSEDLIKENLINTYTPMRWDLSLDKLCDLGVTRFIDVSPNGAIKKISRLKNRKAKIYTFDEV